MIMKFVLGGVAVVAVSAAAIVVVNRRHIGGVGKGINPRDPYMSGLDFVTH